MSKCNGVVKQIFKDHFKEFWKNKQNKFPGQMREHMFKEVIKMINCGEFALGFVSYV
jgi:hypothetical protein